MKKYGMLAIATIFMFSIAVMAQNPTSPQGNGEKREFKQGDRPQATPQMRAERLAKQLNLTDDEKGKVQALFEKHDANRMQNQSEVKKSREEMKTQFDAERKAQDEELAKIIGQEKFQKYQEARAERMKNRGNRPNQPNN